MVQQMVKKMVAEQVKQEMEKQKKLNRACTSGRDNIVLKNTHRKSPSDTILYAPAVPVNDRQLNLSLKWITISDFKQNWRK